VVVVVVEGGREGGRAGRLGEGKKSTPGFVVVALRKTAIQNRNAV
jgi:hypothetical protein